MRKRYEKAIYENVKDKSETAPDLLDGRIN
jgi:hypothetical protein